MAGEKNLLNQLARQARRFDDAALEAFANKGILRRARKDFAGEDVPVFIESADENQLKLRVAEALVSLNEKGITQAACDCPSTEICRHILIACFWLAEQAGETGTDAEAAPEIAQTAETDKKSAANFFQNLLDISLPALEKRAGKRIFRQAVEFLQKNESFRISHPNDEIRLVEFADASVSVRLVADVDLRGHLCSCRSAEICRHKIAAVLAFRREKGVEFLPMAAEADKPAQKLSPAQIKALRSAQKLMLEFIEIGIAHLSESSFEQMQTLATSAGGASLFRLSFALKNLADGLRLSLARSAQADSTAWLLSLAKTYALAAALLDAETPDAKFIGSSRTAYEEIGQLELAGVGAYRWQTLSGFHGLTALFWDDAAKRFFSWTDARPVSDKTFSPLGAFRNEMRWQGAMTPAQAASSVVKLQNPQRNAQNRLSGSAQIRALVKEATETEKLDFAHAEFSRWQDLREYFAGIFPSGLRERQNLKEFVVARPADFGHRFFDATTQIFEWQLIDEDRAAMALKIPFNPLNETAIEVLEKIENAADEIDAVLARVALDAGGLFLQPVSLFLKPESSLLPRSAGNDNQSRIFHLNLPAQPVEKSKSPPTENAPTEIEIEENVLPENLPAGTTARKIFEAREILQILAESGTNSVAANLLEKLTPAAKSLREIGVTTLAESISNLAASPRNEFPARLLKLVFLTQLSLETAQIRGFTK